MIIKTKINNTLTDVSEMVSSITWAGSSTEIARSLNITWLYPLHDYYIPKIYPTLGQDFYFYDDKGNEVFRGKVYQNERTNTQGTISITAYDDGIRLAKSKGTFNFKNMTAENITQKAAAEIGISCNSLASTKINQKMLCEGKGLYEIITEAYKGAADQNGKSYKVLMMEGKLNVIEVGAEVLPYVLRDDKNITEFSFTEDAQNIINKIKIYDGNAKYLDVVSNQQSMNLFGIIQDNYTKEEDKQARAVATSNLKQVERTVSVTVIGNISLISGYAVKLIDTSTNIAGNFIIQSDSHEWSNGQYFTRLDLTYKGGATVG